MTILPGDLAALPALPGGLTALAGPLDGRAATGVRLVEDLTALSAVPEGAVAVLTAPAARRATGYRLDVALRDAAAAGAAALVLTAPAEAPPVPGTARVIAERGGTALLHAAPGPELAAFVTALARAVDGDAADALARQTAAIDAVLDAAGDPDRVLAAASAALGVPLRQGAPGPGETGAAARGPDGEVAVAAADPGGHLGRAAARVARLAAETIARAGAEDVPVRSRTLLLSELLVAPEGQALRLLSAARALGLPVDGWHVALRVEPAALTGPDRYELLDAVDRAALRVLRTGGGAPWHSARADDALLLIRTQAADPGRDGLRAAVATTERLLADLRARFPDADLRGGVGGVHQGPLGLRTSAREARTAVTRGERGGGRPVTVHDLAGLDRMLGEWYASDTARASAAELLAPITALGPERARPLLRTLQSYLDHQGSPARAAEDLYLHRNAVTDRVRRASALLGVDLADPEQRLAVQLACRAVSM
ncbi:PucR family transcriptional regulator [Spirillospora sp. NPDC127200]